MKRALLALILSCAFSLLWSGAVMADAGVTVSPPFQDLQLKPDQLQTSFVYSVTNDDPLLTKNFSLSSADFGSLDESGGLVFLGTEVSDLAKHKYGLINWMQIEPSSLTLGPHQTANIKVTIQNNDSLAPGGHYGAILLSQTNLIASKQVVVQSILSTLIFAAKLGGEKYGLHLDKVEKDSGWWQTYKLKLRFQNTGNIHLVPRGTVRVIDPLGREVGRAAINEESAKILPEAFRSFTLALTHTRRVILPGRYMLEVSYRYDGQVTPTIYRSSLYYFDIWGVVAIIISLAVLVGGSIVLYKFVSKRFA